MCRHSPCLWEQCTGEIISTHFVLLLRGVSDHMVVERTDKASCRERLTWWRSLESGHGVRRPLRQWRELRKGCEILARYHGGDRLQHGQKPRIVNSALVRRGAGRFVEQIANSQKCVFCPCGMGTTIRNASQRCKWMLGPNGRRETRSHGIASSMQLSGCS